ncbi:SixA phosphatase family protein [Lyngbya confervoides]|uniref:Histidine phosphatase family protein n=1 Tax=Lyngbya confervoides BDU141951 TaxID=1574623 RepID=A0ABD4T3W4_9CYAN|nr:histidine phosphatase family protein [Lyngbya confervoides]MCM1983364.1 histidine phosphatase family protein [Lyngbya confervoides BDU141951]
MTLNLLLMRHGKSDWSDDVQRDHDRPLAPRGIKAAQFMGQTLARAEQLPELIISSTAVRARTTAEEFIAALGIALPMQTCDQFYDSTPEQVLQVIRKLNGPDWVMVVGHEPTWSRLTSLLMGGGTLIFPTAAIARIEFDCELWSQVRPRQGALKWLLQPKFLMSVTQ